MLEVFREVEASGEEIVITDRGQPVLKIVPIRRQEDVDQVFADLRRRARLPSDEELTAPIGDEPFADSDLAALL